MAPYGAVALGEIDEVCERLKARQGEPDAWREEWCAMGKRLERAADAAAGEGRELTAGNYYLRAGMYYFTGERFVVPGEEKREIGRKALQCQHAGLERRYPNLERVEVPYEKTTLPALFMKAPGASGRAPTVVVFDGMDNCKEMSVLFAGLEFARRGWHTLAIDGPGQGESLRLRGLHARHDYEVPGAAAYEYVAGRREVDAQKVVVMGYSFGGYYASRIAAFEKRYCAGVAMSALHWDLAGGNARSSASTRPTQDHTAIDFSLPLDHGGRERRRGDRAGRALLAGGSRSEHHLPVSHRARRGRQGRAGGLSPQAFRGDRRPAKRPEDSHRRGRRQLSRASRQPASRDRRHRRLDHSALAPESLTTFAHFAISSRTYRLN